MQKIYTSLILAVLFILVGSTPLLASSQSTKKIDNIASFLVQEKTTAPVTATTAVFVLHDYNARHIPPGARPSEPNTYKENYRVQARNLTKSASVETTARE